MVCCLLFLVGCAATPMTTEQAAARVCARFDAGDSEGVGEAVLAASEAGVDGEALRREVYVQCGAGTP